MSIPQQNPNASPLRFAGHDEAMRELKPLDSRTKADLIESILIHNPTASQGFLARFSIDQLRSYLDHLVLASSPRGTRPWVRQGHVPAVVAYRTPA
jgi:hypothetical protein